MSMIGWILNVGWNGGGGTWGFLGGGWDNSNTGGLGWGDSWNNNLLNVSWLGVEETHVR